MGEPFPLDVYPQEVQRFVLAATQDIGCPLDYIAAGVLPVAGTALGSRVKLVLSDTWTERACFWVALVGESGVKKSPAVKALCLELREIDSLLGSQFVTALAMWKESDPQTRGPKPVLKKLLVSDATIEALRDTLDVNPCGLLWSTGELLGWVNSMGEYKQGKGKDRQHWLEIYSGEPLNVIRVGKEAQPSVRDPYCSVIGGIQPALLSKLAGEDGLQARLMLVRGERSESTGLPDRKVGSNGIFAQFTDVDRGYPEWNEVVRRLYGLRQDGCVLYLSEMAWIYADKWLKEHEDGCEDKQNGKSEEWREACRKATGFVFRIAIVLWALDGGNAGSREINEDQMKRACTLSEWFMRSAETVLGLVDQSNDRDREWSRKLDELKRKIVENPDWSRSDLLRRGPRWIRNSKVVSDALRSLDYSPFHRGPLAGCLGSCTCNQQGTVQEDGASYEKTI